MKQNTKESIKSGLTMGGLFGLTVGTHTLFACNGMVHLPYNVLLNVAFPAAATVGGFVAGYSLVKESNEKSKKDKNDIILNDILDLLDKSDATTEEKIAILEEQKNLLTANKEEINDKPKTR